jgi:hypothetical protein
MKQSFFKVAFLIIAVSIVSAIVGAHTNACDKKLFTKNCIRQKQPKQKKTSAVVKETAVYTDLILTNSILRF